MKPAPAALVQRNREGMREGGRGSLDLPWNPAPLLPVLSLQPAIDTLGDLAAIPARGQLHLIVKDHDFGVPTHGSKPQMPLLSVALQLVLPGQEATAAGHAVGRQLVA